MSAPRRITRVLVAAAATPLIALSACSGDDTSDPTGGDITTSAADGSTGSTADADFPDVVGAVLRNDGDSWSLDVTMSSEYDTPERYADGWRVLDPDGNELGAMELTHDHAGEQPFTRTQTGLEIPDGIDRITIEGHDLENGYGGATLEVDLS